MSGLAGLTALDIGVLAVLGLSALLGLARGAVREALAIATWVGAFAVAWWGFDRLRPVMMRSLQHDLLADLATLAIVFLVPLVAFKILAGLVGRMADRSGLGLLDRTLGLAFGVARGAFLVCAAYLLFSILSPPAKHPDWVTQARFLPQLKTGAGWLERAVPESWFEKSKSTAQEVKAKAVGEAGYAEQPRRQLERLIK